MQPFLFFKLLKGLTPPTFNFAIVRKGLQITTDARRLSPGLANLYAGFTVPADLAPPFGNLAQCQLTILPFRVVGSFARFLVLTFLFFQTAGNTLPLWLLSVVASLPN